MALSPDDKFIYVNPDTTSGEYNFAQYFPVKYLQGLECANAAHCYLFFRGPKNARSTRVQVAITSGYIKEFFTQLIDEINFGEDSVILLSDRNIAVDATTGGTIFSHVNASTAVSILSDVTSTPYGNLFVGESLTVTGDIASTSTILSGWHGSTNRIKILASDFIPDDGGRPIFIDDTGSGSENFFLESHSSLPLYATVAIPTGFTATKVMVYGSATDAIEVWEMQINSKTGVSKGTGNVDTEIDITDVESSTTNYLLIQVANASGNEIHGGYVTITTS
jgi:hypothetical protein